MHQKSRSYQDIQTILTEHFGDRSINAGDVSLVGSVFGKEDVIHLIHDVLNNPELLHKVANRSYTHALGFDKIVLMDLRKDSPDISQKTQLRLHIWNPENTGALPIVEALHEHSFDFVSTVLTGHLENQQFLLSPLSKREEAILEKLRVVITQITPDDLKFINDQMEIVEALKLSGVGSSQFHDLNMHETIDLDRINDLTGFSYNEILLLCSIEGHYVSNRISGERQAYKHVLKDYVSLTPFCAMSLDEGDSYFHPYQLPHRLYYDNKILNSTILVTTEVPSNPEGGSLQRPTYVQKDEQSYDKIVLTSESLSKILTDYLDYLGTH
jgi:hypothetical protein